MTVEIPDGWMQAVYRFTHTGVPRGWSIVLGHNDDIGATNDTNAADLADAFGDNLMARFEDSTALVEVKTLVNRSGSMQVGLWKGNLIGTNGGFSQPPPQCALLIHKQTGLAGRAHRGRIYMGAGSLAEASVDDAGVVTGAVVTAWNTGLAAWRTDLIGRDLEPALLHHEGGPPGAPDMITAHVCDTRVATQRRRLR